MTNAQLELRSRVKSHTWGITRVTGVQMYFFEIRLRVWEILTIKRKEEKRRSWQGSRYLVVPGPSLLCFVFDFELVVSKKELRSERTKEPSKDNNGQWEQNSSTAMARVSYSIYISLILIHFRFYLHIKRLALNYLWILHLLQTAAGCFSFISLAPLIQCHELYTPYIMYV